MTFVLFIGFLIGMAHALEADHLAAVASFSIRGKSSYEIVKKGISWGLGHTITLFIVVVPLFLLGAKISPRLESSLEGLVGLVLIFLGARLIWQIRRERVHVHIHSHNDDRTHVHVHSHKDETGHHAMSLHEHKHASGLSWLSLSVGSIHGLAGSASLLLLVYGQLEAKWMVVPFVAIFGIGSIVGMALVSQIISIPLRKASSSGAWILIRLQYAIAAGAVSIGTLFFFSGVGSII